MKVLDLFCGLGGWASAFTVRGHEVVGVDWDERFSPDVGADVFDLKPKDLPGPFDIVLASPPCEKFSVLTLGRNWHRDGRPKTGGAAKAEALVWATRILIEALDPAFFLIENPTGKLRVLRPLADLEMRTVTYCQYGAPWRKSTDLWGGFPPSLVLRPVCTPSAPCHMASDVGERIHPLAAKDGGRRGGGPTQAQVGLGSVGHLPSPRNEQTAINDRTEQHPRVTAWAEEMQRIVENNPAAVAKSKTQHVGVSDVLGGGTMRGGHAFDPVFTDEAECNAAEIADREWNRKPKRHVAAAQNNGDKSFQRSAIRAMIPPELSLEVCIAAERDLEAGRTWRDGQHLPDEALATGLFAEAP